MKILTPIDMSGLKVGNLADPSNPQDAVTKAYLDAALQGLKWKNPVRVTTTGNIVLSGLQVIDGVSVVANDRVLVKNQATAANNGLYIVSAGAWVRATDFDLGAELLCSAVLVSEGTTQGNSAWTMTSDDPLTLGTTALTWTQFGASTTYTPGTGISIVGSVISVDTAVTARKAGATIGDGVTTAFNVVHNLGTSDVMVIVREAAGAQAAILVDWAIVDVNTVSLAFAIAPAVGQYRVFVLG